MQILTAPVDTSPPTRRRRAWGLAGAYIVLWVVLWYAAKIADSSGFSLWFLPVGLRYFIYLVYGWSALPLELAATLTVSLLQIASSPTTSFPLTATGLGWFIYNCCASPLVYAAVVIPLRRILKAPIDFTNQSHLVYFLGSALLASSLGALVGVIHLVAGANFPAQDAGAVLSSWFVGDLIGIITLSPFLLFRITPVIEQFARSNPSTGRDLALTAKLPRKIDRTDLVTALTMTGAVLVTFGIQRWLQIDLQFPAITLLLLMPLIWLSIRYGLSAVVLAIALLDGMLIIAVIQLNRGDGVEQYQLVMILLSVVSLWLGSSVNARFDLLARHAQVLEREVKQQTASLRSLNEELKQSHQEAIRANAEKSRFLTAASHDLRQPIHAVGMFVERLNHRTNDAISRDILGKVNAAIAEFQDLLDGLLDLSQLDRHSNPLNIRDFPVQSLFDYIDQIFAEPAAQKGLTFKIRPSDVWLRSDSTLLRRVLLNLVSNAIKYTQHGTVLMACRPSLSGQHVRIEVRDSGVGIDAAQQAHIFREFYQVGNASRNRQLGIGIGLSIVERSCALLGVPITLQSALGQGTCVSLLVPLGKVSPRNRLESDQVRPFSDALDHQHVMLIEDDVMNRDAVSGLLEQWGYHVAVMTSAETALDAVRNGVAVDFVMADFHLPGGLDGVDAIRSIRAETGRDIPACIMSGRSDTETRDKVSAAGLTFLSKPVRPANLRSVLRRGISAKA